MRIVALQYDIAWEDRAANVATARRLAAAAAPEPGSLLVLPEMGLTGFSMNVDQVAESPARESENAMAGLAREFRSWVVGGLVTRAPDGRGLNEAIVIAPDGSTRARYAKMHPFTYTSEEKYYAAGDEVVVLACGGFQLAPFVCYDLRFPEVFRTAARRGATLMVVIASWLDRRHAHWGPLLAARAIENQAWVVGVNRVGRDPKHAYLGGTCIIDPAGNIVAAATGPDEAAVCAEADASVVEKVRAEFPVLGDLRTDWTRP